MANRAKGWNVLNHRKQLDANRSRQKVEKVVDKDGVFLNFKLTPAKRLPSGWTIPMNDHKRERIAIMQELKRNGKWKKLTRAERRKINSRKRMRGAKA